MINNILRGCAEREGNEPNSQYVGYQIFVWPADAGAMNYAGDKERMRFIWTNLRIAGQNVVLFCIIPGKDAVNFLGESALNLV